MKDCQGCICERCEHNNGVYCAIDENAIFDYTCKNCDGEREFCVEFKECGVCEDERNKQ